MSICHVGVTTVGMDGGCRAEPQERMDKEL